MKEHDVTILSETEPDENGAVRLDTNLDDTTPFRFEGVSRICFHRKVTLPGVADKRR